MIAVVLWPKLGLAYLLAHNWRQQLSLAQLLLLTLNLLILFTHTLLKYLPSSTTTLTLHIFEGKRSNALPLFLPDCQKSRVVLS